MADINITVSIDAAISITVDTNAVPSLITQAEAETGTSTGERVVTAQRIAQAIAALESATPAATTPGGSTTQVQFNDASAFGGMAGVKWTKATKKLQLGEGSDPIIEEHKGQIYQIIQGCGNQTGTYSIDCTSYNDHIITAIGALNIQLSNIIVGMGGFIVLKMDAIGGYVVTLDAGSFTTELNGSDTIDTDANAINLISYWYDGTYVYYTITNEA